MNINDTLDRIPEADPSKVRNARNKHHATPDQSQKNRQSNQLTTDSDLEASPNIPKQKGSQQNHTRNFDVRESSGEGLIAVPHTDVTIESDKPAGGYGVNPKGLYPDGSTTTRRPLPLRPSVLPTVADLPGSYEDEE